MENPEPQTKRKQILAETREEKRAAVLAELLKAAAAAYEGGDSELALCYMHSFEATQRKWQPKRGRPQ